MQPPPRVQRAEAKASSSAASILRQGCPFRTSRPTPPWEAPHTPLAGDFSALPQWHSQS